MNGIESAEEEVNGWIRGDILHHRRRRRQRRRRIEGPLISPEEDGGRQWKCSSHESHLDRPSDRPVKKRNKFVIHPSLSPYLLGKNRSTPRARKSDRVPYCRRQSVREKKSFSSRKESIMIPHKNSLIEYRVCLHSNCRGRPTSNET